ncbi:GMC oxidoreductase [Endozoicomonas sp. ALE010]|uniref:GMC oxidoreductase n=1 Tax=Endozoicomonas sp. ALE010 TaxID=3403081 RepID=UPI003BB79AD1
MLYAGFGRASSSSPEALLGTPTTAHILGGCVMGENRYTGVINNKGQVFGYENMYVCDGSAISANPGVNPSLSIK